MIPSKTRNYYLPLRVRNFLPLSRNYQIDRYFLEAEPRTNVRGGPKHSMNFSRPSEGFLVALVKGREDRSTHISWVGDNENK